MDDLYPLLIEYLPHLVFGTLGLILLATLGGDGDDDAPVSRAPAGPARVDGPVECPRCRGDGEMHVADVDAGQIVQVPCSACGGAGQVLGYEAFDYDDHRRCLECQGTGYVRDGGAVAECAAPECSGGWRVVRGARGYRNIRPLRDFEAPPDEVLPPPPAVLPPPIPDSSAPPMAAAPVSSAPPAAFAPDSSAPPAAAPSPIADAELMDEPLPAAETA